MSIIESRLRELSSVDTLKALATDVGAEVYIVGGTVRDIILQGDIEDIDITLFNYDYIEFSKLLANRLNAYHTPFKDNVAIMSKSGEHLFDISKPRGKNIYEDLLLRDFTINNLAIDMDYNLIGDDTDIIGEVIRKAYRNSLVDDPIRILRIFRFYSTLNFTIDDDTLFEAVKEAPKVQTVAYERVQNELSKLLAGRYFDKAIDIMNEMGILKNIFNNAKINLKSIKYIKDNKPLINNYILSFTLASIIDKNNLQEVISKLKLSNKMVKEIVLFEKAIRDILSAKSDNDLMQFVYNFYHDYNIVKHFLKANGCIDTTVENQLDNYYNRINIDVETVITGDILQERYGMTPSSRFKDILYNVRFKLVYGLIDETSLDNYVKEIVDEVR